MRKIQFTLWSILVVLLAACGQDDPQHTSRDLQLDKQTDYTITFDTATDFETGTFAEQGSLSIRDGVYHIEATNTDGASYLWGSTSIAYPALKNVMIEVEATPRDGSDDNWYGVLCRVDEVGAGYGFLVGSDGFWAIVRTDGRSIAFLERWQQADVIKTGKATNTLRVYCLDDYLAFYINDEFVGDHKTNEFDHVGQVGLLAGGEAEKTVSVEFDNLRVASAQLGDNANTPPPPTPTATLEPTATNTLTPVPLATLPVLDVPTLGAPPPSDN